MNESDMDMSAAAADPGELQPWHRPRLIKADVKQSTRNFTGIGSDGGTSTVGS